MSVGGYVINEAMPMRTDCRSLEYSAHLTRAADNVSGIRMVEFSAFRSFTCFLAEEDEFSLDNLRQVGYRKRRGSDHLHDP